MMEAYDSIYEKKCVDKKDKGAHNCAKKVCHEEYGEGETIFGQHAVPDENGFVSHYDVQFEHGIVENVSVDELEIITEGSHNEENHHYEGEMIGEAGGPALPGEPGRPGTPKAPGGRPHLPGEKKTPAPKKGVSLQLAGTDLFDIIKGHLVSEGYANTEDAALVIMANMSEEWRQSIIEKWEAHYGLVGVPKKAIDAIPGVRKVRTAVSNTLHRMNYPGVKPVTVGDKVVPYEYINPGAFAGLRNRGMKPAGRVTDLETGDSKSGGQIGREMTRND